MTDREMKEIYPALTTKCEMVLTDDGIYRREGKNNWRLLEGQRAAPEKNDPLPEQSL